MEFGKYLNEHYPILKNATPTEFKIALLNATDVQAIQGVGANLVLAKDLWAIGAERSDIANQALLPDISTEAHEILEYVNDYPRSPKALVRFFNEMAEVINGMGNPLEDETAMFRDEGPQPSDVTAKNVIDIADKNARGGNQGVLRTENESKTESGTDNGYQDSNTKPEPVKPSEGKDSIESVQPDTRERAVSAKGTGQLQEDALRETGKTVETKQEQQAEKRYAQSDIAIEQNISNGTNAMREVIAKHKDVRNAMYRNGIGSIDFLWGKEGEGRTSKKAMESLTLLLNAMQKTERALKPLTS